MNVLTDPERLRASAAPMPAKADLPIRSDFLTETFLHRLGKTLARDGRAALVGFDNFDFQRRLRQNAEIIFGVYRTTNEAQARGEQITPAANWLLDNNYLVEDTIHQIRRDLPRRFYRELPSIPLESGEKIPRVLAIAWLYVAHTDSAVSSSGFKAVVDGYQEVEPLKIGELWALPSVLRFVLVENLRRLALRVNRARELRLIANALADRLLTLKSADNGAAMLSDFVPHARDTTFATQLLYRLRDGSKSAGQALTWLETELERSGTDAEETIIAEHQTLSSGNVTTGNIVRGLRLINDIDWTVWFEAVSKVDRILSERSDFRTLDFASRDQYRAAIEQLARRSKHSEFEVAEQALAMAAGDAAHACDIGFFLIGPRRVEMERALDYVIPVGSRVLRAFRGLGWAGIAGPVLALTALMLFLAGWALAGAGLSTSSAAFLLVLFIIPASEAAVGVFNTLALRLLKPTRLIGYEYKHGVPIEARTLVVVPALIGTRDDIEDSVSNLEIHFLANMKGDLYFALLSDWPDSPNEQDPADLELLDYARKMVVELNGRYALAGVPRFHLLHRRRLYNETQRCWMGWERKRGKLHELNLLLRGDSDTTFFAPDQPLPEGVVHVMTLDADTRMTRDAVTQLVGKLRHPLNRPVVDLARERIGTGYGILQPRVTASLTTGREASFFQRVFSASRGLDPYVFAVSDVYQDIFGEGTFTGKGLYHVDAMEAALKGRIAENSVLSHDLLEGAFARAALASDVEVVEDYPTRYAVDASRQHRWVRGDWQLLPYILNPNSGVQALSRWKMIDNLRRSLTPIFWVLASIVGWTLLPFHLAVQWQALLVVSLVVAQTFDVVDSLLPRTMQMTPRGHLRKSWRDFAFATAHVALRTVFAAHQAWLMADAILRTLFRLYVSGRNLLEWRTASQAHRVGANDIVGYFQLMGGALAIAAAGLVLPLLAGSAGAGVAAIFALFWASSPALAWVVSRSAETEDQLRVSPDEANRLRTVARRTWLYFETFVTAEHNCLPPDNFQETPNPVVAGRTSPTNIGVYLLSVVSARDFGWISMADALDRIDRTLRTVETMQRFKGHLYNWYDTRTLRPLHPLYVSSVDSGNLAGHLIAAAAACRTWSEVPFAYLQGDLQGILDVVAINEESLVELPDDRRLLRPLRKRLRDRLDGMRRAVGVIRDTPETAAIRTINLAVLAGEIRRLSHAIHSETDTPISARLDEWAGRLEATCEAHMADSHLDQAAVDALRGKLGKVGERARLIAFQMDFSVLLRSERKLLSIGYRVEEHQLDESCYDLLASEARLTSLFAIAKGDIATEHWFRLGRPIVEVGFRGALMSWSGSMFEYLMPPLVMKEPHGGILNQTSNLIIRKQIWHGRARNIPWGISEAAYNARDREMTYQYTNFGVPGLGLKRGLALNTVVAPYATLLAAQFKPREAVLNLARLKSMGALGHYGYYDAVDFTPSRLPDGVDYAVVANYMAHHQGMSIVAVANVVFRGRMRDRFHADPVIEAAELLLQEKAPRDIPVATVRTEATDRGGGMQVEDSPDSRLFLDPAVEQRAVSLLSNGHYSVMVTTTGSGYSRFNELAVTRWKPDSTQDRDGAYLFLTDAQTGEWWSATTQPKRAPGEIAQALFCDDKASFTKTVGTLRSEVEVIVASEGDGEARRITIFNDGFIDRHIDATSFAEIALAPEASDSAHPAFSKMFVETEIDPKRNLIFARRHKRAANEPDIALAHFVTEGAGVARDTEAETDRRAFIGRGRSIANAAAFDRGARLGGGDGFVLDPVMALRCRIRVPASKKITLTFWTVVGRDRGELEAAIQRLDHPESFRRQAMLAWTRSQVQTRHVGLSLAYAAGVQKLARYLIYPDAALRAPSASLASGLARQSVLWPMAISGDFPIFALRIGDIADIEIVANALRMQEYMRARGLLADLVIVNEQASSYVQDLQQAIESLCENSRLRGTELGPRQHIFAVRRDLMDEASYRALLAAARIVLHTRNGTIVGQLEREETTALRARGEDSPSLEPFSISSRQPARTRVSTAPRKASGDGLSFWNGIGGFDRDGRDYVVRLDGKRSTPQPWINVISNPAFGFHISAEGASFTWSRNSRDFQLTPWSNDPVTNRPGEAVYIHDMESGAAFSPTASVLRDESVVYQARHGQGFSTFSARHGNIASELTCIVDPQDPLRISELRIKNLGWETARLRVYAYVEWVLGNNRARAAPYIVTQKDAATGALLARNAFSLEFGDRVAFLASDHETQSVTSDRTAFFGADGTVESPETVLAGAPLDGMVETGRDPCAAMAHDIVIGPGEEKTICWLLGDAASQEEAAALVVRQRERAFDERLILNEREWSGFLGTLQVETPDEAFDAMANFWLPYQSLACRIRARSAFYQASGAYGFRDQLQDTLALLLHDPNLARAQILNAARRQFPEGDVQHWWLPSTGAGVRTMISDDVVWLAYAVVQYMEVTGDAGMLHEAVPFIEGASLKEGEHDAFFTPDAGEKLVSIYEHCARALDLAVKRTGESGLPLILGGDWNDGMNRVGEQGKGESVWLGWFLLKTLLDFAPIARGEKDVRRADRWEKHAARLKTALEETGWDGDWYRRGSFDDGSPLGSHLSEECKIDSIAQSWSVLSGQGDREKANRALDSARDLLIDRDAHIARLFTPPFSETDKEPGYIKSYPPGVRENGGQYTHAATWFVIALAQAGRADEAYELFKMLNPVNHALDEAAAEQYRVEPYVVAADVYSIGDKTGRGGWTWYTGSAGWLYRAAVEAILGIRKQGNILRVQPAIPREWEGFSATLRIADALYRIQVRRDENALDAVVELDGQRLADGAIPLRHAGEHEIRVTIPRQAAPIAGTGV